MTFEEFCGSARAYCTEMEASVTSWGRTKQHNLAVGGAPRSLHLVWKAVDVVYDAPPPALELRQTIARTYGLYVWPEGDHDHIRPMDETTA